MEGCGRAAGGGRMRGGVRVSRGLRRRLGSTPLGAPYACGQRSAMPTKSGVRLGQAPALPVGLWREWLQWVKDDVSRKGPRRVCRRICSDMLGVARICSEDPRGDP